MKFNRFAVIPVMCPKCHRYIWEVNDMKGRDLIEKLKDYEDFDIKFMFSEEPCNGSCFPTIRHFNDLDVGDIGYSDKVVFLSGEEY